MGAENEELERKIVMHILDGISVGGLNSYFAYSNLSKDLKEKYSLYDIDKLFHELEWNVKVIEIDRIYETDALYPWKGKGSVKKNVVQYRIRDEFRGWKYKPKLFEKMMENLHKEDAMIDFDPVKDT
ncbi:MAG: hypothetical protein QMC77_08575 [Methanocellales archaeon]|nr:hypothetical protein [Methanocellales archaeon]